MGKGRIMKWIACAGWLAVLSLLSGTVAAQPDMNVFFKGDPVPNGGTANFEASKGFTAPIAFVAENNGTTDLNFPFQAMSVSNAVNCTASPATQPSGAVAPGNSRNFSITISTPSSGTYSFDVSIDSDDPVKNPYTFTVSGDVVDRSDDSGGGDDGGCSTSQGASYLMLSLVMATAALLPRTGVTRHRRQ
jgi:hypothetical protein